MNGKKVVEEAKVEKGLQSQQKERKKRNSCTLVVQQVEVPSHNSQEHTIHIY